MKLWSVILVCALAVTSHDVFAKKRLGGGTSIGQQSGNVAQRNAPPPASPATAPSQSANPSQAAAPAAAAKPATAQRPWGAMLGGLAAGLGLAWLASSLGFGEAFAQFLLFALLGVAVMVVIGLVMRARAGQGQAAQRSPLAFQGAGAGASAGAAQAPRSYSPQNVGNDASARPWERQTTSFESSGFGASASAASGGSLIGSALGGSQTWGIPADFDVEGFLRASKTNFINLQAAWDRADVPSLRAMMTDDMLEQIKAQLADREIHAGAGLNKTEVVMLDAQLLGIEELDTHYMASVEFSGMIREEPSAGPNPFREVWNITRPKNGAGGWLVAGVQALQ